jgi:8-oxo-dGTP pyrophosphatase MutT (NUDIX family)
MPASDYMKSLRRKIGHDLLLTPGAAGLVFDESGRVLVQQRSESGEWSLPGGAIDPGESPADAVRRELREEAGLEVEPVRVAGVFGGRAHRITYPSGDVAESTTVVFECRVVGGELRMRDGESWQLRWFAPREMPELIAPYPAELFERRGGPALF